MKTRRMKMWSFTIVITLATMLCIVAIGCKEEPDDPPPPQPVAQTFPVVVNTNVTVEIKFMALPNTTPSYIPKIQQALSWMGTNGDFGGRTGTVSINVISGNSGFVKNGSKTLDVGDEWLSSKSDEDIYDVLTYSVTFLDSWFE